MSTKRQEHSERFPTLAGCIQRGTAGHHGPEGPASRSLEAGRRGARASRGRQPRDPTSVLPDGNSLPGPPSATAPPGAQARPQGSSPPAATALFGYKMAAGGGRRAALGTQRLSSPASGFRPRSGADKAPRVDPHLPLPPGLASEPAAPRIGRGLGAGQGNEGRTGGPRPRPQASLRGRRKLRSWSWGWGPGRGWGRVGWVGTCS